jgi:hypothetical protein
VPSAARQVVGRQGLLDLSWWTCVADHLTEHTCRLLVSSVDWCATVVRQQSCDARCSSHGKSRSGVVARIVIRGGTTHLVDLAEMCDTN